MMTSSEGKAFAFAHLVTWALTLLLAAFAVVSYPPALIGKMVVSTLLLVVVATAGRWLFGRDTGSLSDSTGLFVIVFSAVMTVQTLVAREVYGPLRAIDVSPGYVLIAWVLHCVVVASVVLAGRERSRQVGLGAAVVYSSTFYLPAFATPEMGASFVPLMALALALLARELSAPRTADLTHHTPLLTALALFGFFALVASLFSTSPSDSTTWFPKLLTLGLLMLVTPLAIRTQAQWERMALLVVTMSIAVPVFLSAAKLIELGWQLGAWVVAEYKMGLTELGGPNLIARAVLVGAPLSVALAITAPRRGWRLLWWALNALALLVLATCQSWGAMIALALTLAFAGILAYGARWRAWWQTHVTGLGQYLLYALGIAIIVAGLLGFLRLAPTTNVTSFNGRLFQFRTAIREIADQPLLGIGPGHYHVKSRYTTGLNWLVDTQVTRDHPLTSVYHLRGAATLHHHNLFFEIGVGIGLLGLALFLWFLVELYRLGLATRAQIHGANRVWLAGCLIGIFASLAWGLLDVMEISPPFFTFPTWALVGLVLAAPGILCVAERQGARDGFLPSVLHRWSTTFPRLSRRALQVIWLAVLGFLAVVLIVLPLLGNLHYRTGFTAFQEHRWSQAVDDLTRATRWEPLNAKIHQLRAEALINLGRYDEAIAAYERAADLKREFATYHAQLGWLAWLRGDVKQATVQFEKAVEMDPREAWRDALHADLGLAYAAQGRAEDAIPLLQETIKLDPQMALAPYWVPAVSETGHFEVMLDPVYLDGPSSELEKRILGHLGKADYTPRLFDLVHIGRAPITLNEVLDGIEKEYQAALQQEGRKAPRLLATVAEAARLAGLEDRAERTYLAFQAAFPESVYGFRDLGTLYREQGRLREAQEQLEQAVHVSPRDTASWLALAQVYLTRQMLDEAQAALDTVNKQEPLEPNLYELRAQLHLKREETAQAADALAKALVIEESIPNRLALAELYRVLGDPAQATGQCSSALDALLRTWPRPLDPQLWDIGVCLAQSPGELPKEVTALTSEQALAGNVLLGHIYRARGELDQAAAAYQAAADARPDLGGPHYFLGETYQALDQPESAETEYRLAAHLNPQESLPLLALGRMQWAQGQQEASLESFQAAVEATPGWSQAHVALGNTLLALDDPAGAAQYYQRAQIADGDVVEGLVYDFAARLGEVGIKAPSPEYVRNDYFAIDGQERRVLFMHPDSSARYIVNVPAESILAFDLATDPGSWDQPGDGVAFAIYVESDQGKEQIFSTYIDPKQDEAARHWHPFTLDLGEYGGQMITLVFETGSGPAGDNRFDWAGWGTPWLLAP